jgi:predicted metal-dependent phosphoesterase TrpH
LNIPTRCCDLHTHSTWSDGIDSATTVVENALRKGLTALALTDHDTVLGIPEARRRAEGTDLEIITGVELSSSEGELEIHILGYLFDETNGALLEQLDAFRDIRRTRALAMVERLKKLGKPLDEEDVLRRAKGDSVGRPHVAEAMVECGYVSSVEDAFRRFLGIGGPAWVPKPIFTPLQAIQLITDAGGVTSVAHPATIGRDDLIAELADLGLTGLECMHPKHDAALLAHYRTMADELGLVVTGGSDCHGRRPEGSVIGYGNVPASTVDALREAQAVRGRG